MEVISLDPGFHSLKIIHNYGKKIIPFFAIKTETTKYDNFINNKNFIIFRNDLTQETYYVGDYAKQRIFNKQINENVFYSKTRFFTEENTIVMLTGIALALINKDGQSKRNADFILSIGLPHTYEDEIKDNIYDQLAKVHAFSIKIGSNSFMSFNFSIKKDNILITSQSFAAMLSTCMDDNGKITNIQLWNSSLLILDGGFFTFGLLPIDNQKLDEDLAESNTKLSMLNAYKKVCKEIFEKTNREIKFWEIDYIRKNKKGIITYGEKGNLTCDIEPILQDAIKYYAEETIKYINLLFNKAYDIDNIIVAGGTGSSYYEILKKAYGNKVILAESSIKGEKFEPVYAIAKGCYKLGIFYLKQKLIDIAALPKNNKINNEQ